MGFLSRIFKPSGEKSLEGQYREGPYWLPLTGGMLPAGSPWNFWQTGVDPVGPTSITAMVEACVSAYSQTVAMCPGDHWRLTGNDGRKRVTNSSLTRLLRQPNDYQSISDFLLNLTRSLYLEGNAYALALRNDRFEISELHLMHPHQSLPRIGVDGSIFYALSGNEIIQRRLTDMADRTLLVPARDVLHVRLQTPIHPLRGESPIRSALWDIAASGAMTAQQYAFYMNQSRPSNVLATDEKLSREQIDIVREKWNEQSRGLSQGGTPILTAGLKPIPMSMSAQDAQLAEVMKLSDQHIALAFRLPLQILGTATGGGSAGAGATTETLMNSWISQGLGFTLNHIEEALGQLFQLRGQPDEYVELNTRVLLRSSQKDQIESLARGVQGAIFSPNEARAEMELPSVKYGDEPRVQQQVVPLSAAANIPAAPGPPSPPAAPASPSSKPKDFSFESNELLRRRFRASHRQHSSNDVAA